LPDPLQPGQKIMPYRSGLTLLLMVVLSIAIPPCGPEDCRPQLVV
jgi:hypothetical protein